MSTDATKPRTQKPSAPQAPSPLAQHYERVLWALIDQGASTQAIAEALRKIAEAKARFMSRATELRKQRATRRTAQPAPRYDEVFEKGTEMLDAMARSVAGDFE